MFLTSINPATGETIAHYDEMSDETVSALIDEGHSAWQAWRRTAIAERAAPLRNAARLLHERKRDYAELMAREMGKPLDQGEAEIEKCAWVCDYYADNAESFLSPQVIESDASKSYVAFEPLGVVHRGGWHAIGRGSSSVSSRPR